MIFAHSFCTAHTGNSVNAWATADQQARVEIVLEGENVTFAVLDDLAAVLFTSSRRRKLCSRSESPCKADLVRISDFSH